MRETTHCKDEAAANSGWFDRRLTIRGLAAAAGVGTVFAILAPLETGGLGWPGVWFYWTGLMCAGWLIGTALTRGLLAIIPEAWPGWARVLVFALAVTAPMSLLVNLVMAALGQTMTLSCILETTFYVFVISLMMSALGFVLSEGWDAAAAGANPAPGAEGAHKGAAGATLLERLPPRLRSAKILAVASEDHYLRVYTEAGSELVLMRLSDAVRALEGLDGLQVHRSWWVARAAVADIARANGRMTLTLVNGVEAPVSRTFAPHVRAEGWG